MPKTSEHHRMSTCNENMPHAVESLCLTLSSSAVRCSDALCAFSSVWCACRQQARVNVAPVLCVQTYVCDILCCHNVLTSMIILTVIKFSPDPLHCEQSQELFACPRSVASAAAPALAAL